jgi:hypothetical protein
MNADPCPLTLIVFREKIARFGPRFWAQEAGDMGAMYAEGRTLSLLREEVRRKLEKDRHSEWWMAKYGSDALPTVSYRRARSEDRRAVESLITELDEIERAGVFTEATIDVDGRIMLATGEIL